MLLKNFFNKVFHKFINKSSVNSEEICAKDSNEYNCFPYVEILEKTKIRNGKLIILMVDDNPFLRDSTKIYLENLGMTVDCAENGLAGLELFLNTPHKYDIILLDIEMPIMEGIETAKRIRESNCISSKTIPIIAVTGSMFLDNPKMPLFHGNIKKPFEMEQLVTLINKTLFWSPETKL